MFARVGTFEGSPTRIDEFLRQTDRNIGRLRDFRGFQIRAEGVHAERGDKPPSYDVFERAVHFDEGLDA